MGRFIAYVDESGDEGIQRGTEWLIITAVIIDKEKDLAISKSIDDIKATLEILPHKPFHWKEIRSKHTSKKRLVIDRIAREEFCYINIVANTYDLENIQASSKMLYNYFCRFLIERITWYVDEKKGTVKIVFSNRSNTSWNELDEYIKNLFDSNQCEIRDNVISNIEIYDTVQKKMLQFADACASSLGEALNKDKYGYIDERFILKLNDKLYRRKGNLLSYGLKFFPYKYMNKYFDEYEWLKNIK